MTQARLEAVVVAAEDRWIDSVHCIIFTIVRHCD